VSEKNTQERNTSLLNGVIAVCVGQAAWWGTVLPEKLGLFEVSSPPWQAVCLMLAVVEAALLVLAFRNKPQNRYEEIMISWRIGVIPALLWIAFVI